MSSPVVLIIGCGIAGPAVGNFYKRKGYNPIVFDKVPKLGDAGASLMIMSNGLKVLDLLGVAESAKAETVPISALSDASAAGKLFGHSELPSLFAEKYHQPALGITRTTLNGMMRQRLVDLDVDIREGWELTDIKENKNSVTAFFSGGRSVEGSFLVACDGIKSTVRRILLKHQGITEGAPSYTGLTQTTGISETPLALRQEASLRNWYGDGVHIVSYPVSATHTSWAITQRELEETEETWRPYYNEEVVEQRKQLLHVLAGWDADTRQLVNTSEKIIKFGLFDRDELQPVQWHSKRCVLIGDAAHPTSPHLGQGANQALEDCFHLCHSMPLLDPGSEDYMRSLSVLGAGLQDSIFRPFSERRQPRTSWLVQKARIKGNLRVASGQQACDERDAVIVDSFKDSSSMEGYFKDLLREPFQVL